MKVRITNDTGNIRDTKIVDVNSGLEIASKFRSAVLTVDDSLVRATLEAVTVPVDLFAYVDKITTADDFWEIVVSDLTHDVRLDEKDGITRVRIFKKSEDLKARAAGG